MATTTQKRAAKGGEFGANGAWYEGGKFINTIEENGKRQVKKRSKARKVQVKPYVWVESDKQPLFSMVGDVADYVDRYDRNCDKIKPFMPVFLSGQKTSMTLEECQAACDRYNDGELFFE
jgi:hypothetical protein